MVQVIDIDIEICNGLRKAREKYISYCGYFTWSMPPDCVPIWRSHSHVS